MADINLKDFTDLPTILNDTDIVHVNRAGVDYKTTGEQVVKQADIISDLTNSATDKVASAKSAYDLKKLNDWQNIADGIVFNFFNIWDITRDGSELNITTKDGRLLPIDTNIQKYIAAQSGVLPDGGGLVLEFPVSKTSPFTFVSDISTIIEGADEDKFIIAKNIGGLLKSRIPSLQEYFYPTKVVESQLSWDFDTSIVDSDPGTGKFRMNNAAPASVTELYLSKTSQQGVDVEDVLLAVSSGDTIQIIQNDDVLNFIIGTAGTKVDATNYVKVPITVTDNGTLFGSGKECTTSLYLQAEITDIAAEIHGATNKSTPVDADEVGIVDSADNWVLKKLTWANLKAALKTYFDSIFYNAGDLSFALSDEDTDLTTDNDAEINIIRAQTISTITFAVNTAPTGSAITVDVKKNGTTILSSAITLPVSDKTVTVTPTTTGLTVGDVLSADITQIGSTVAGAGAKIYFKTILT